jgi:selenocysteine-specific elongation factor
MPRDLILGTAGHIDHGKTSLVKALTGVDCDRLPEEKQRGITIDIGFANLDLGDFRLGIVDVPGHERFVKNMLAGATGIDLALLIVAADDSVMPQTREHLEILRLLGLQQGVIALTKADLVDETTREVVALEIRELVKGSFLQDAPIIPTSAFSGLGIEDLKAAIRDAGQKLSSRDAAEWFRLAIDRSFVVQGHGTVATGSVTSGAVRVGDELDWHKGDGTTEAVRVRSLNNHGQPVEEVRRGQRAAINLAGVPHEAVRRGQELARPGYLRPSKVVTVRLHTLADQRRPIKHRLPVRLHVGTAEVMATVSVLDADAVEPGKWAIAQLFLDEPVTAVWGQPFVVRDSSAEHTLGGGQVLQPVAVKLRRRHLESLERIEQLWAADPFPRAVSAAWFAGFHGLQPNDLVRAAGVPPDQSDALLQQAIADKKLVELTLPPNRKVYLHADRLAELGERIQDTLAVLHESFPLMTNHDRQKTLARLEYVGDEALLQVVVDRLLKAKQLVGDGKRIARADFKPKLSANQRKLKDKIVDEHKKAGFAPPEPASFANQAAGNAAALKDIFEVAAAEGFLVKVTDEIFLHADFEAEMRRKVEERLKSSPGATVAEIRDLLGTTRKYAVPLCEYLDQAGVTKREGDVRVPAAPPK